MKSFFSFCFFFLIISFSFVATAKKNTKIQVPIKVACVGNSVTFGMGVDNREINCYPAQLQQLLGNGYEVNNFGHSGATLLYKGHKPYVLQPEFRAAMNFKADIVVIHLGLNDTDPRNWVNFRDEFRSNYIAIIDSFRKVEPKVKIWLCKMSPIFSGHRRFLSGTRDWYWEVQEAILDVAKTTKTGYIDLYSPLSIHPDWFPDNIHPTSQGAKKIAVTVHQNITGNFGGLQLSPLYTNNMMLPHQTSFTIKGIANSGEKITISIANQNKETFTKVDGAWEIMVDPISDFTQQYTLLVKSPQKELKFTNVIVGDIWLCAGQSNMAFPVNQSAESQEILSASIFGNIRLLNITIQTPPRKTLDSVWLEKINHFKLDSIGKWEMADRKTVARFSAVGYAFGKMLEDSLRKPIGLIDISLGGSTTEGWIVRKTLESDNLTVNLLTDYINNDNTHSWVREVAGLQLKNSKIKNQRHYFDPSYLYETRVLPIQGFTIKGVIWYQGESNADRIFLHNALFPMVVKTFRNSFHAYDNQLLPFYYVQLSSIHTRPTWGYFRDSQRKLLATIENVGMAVCSDLGDSTDVHPRQKKQVGERLAHWALSQVYGKNVTPSGPLFQNVVFKNGTAEISFLYNNGLQSTNNQPLKSFEIAGENHVFYSATAAVQENKVILKSNNVNLPKYVRYGYQPYTDGNLINGDFLPASTFSNEMIENVE